MITIQQYVVLAQDLADRYLDSNLLNDSSTPKNSKEIEFLKRLTIDFRTLKIKQSI